MAGLVDRVNITHFHSSALRQHKGYDQDITGKYSFQKDVQFAKAISIGSLLNELSVDDIMTTNTDQNVTASHLFTADVTIIANQNLKLNSFTVNNNSFDEIMTVDGNQTITGKKSYSTAVAFQGMYFVTALQGISSVDDFIANKVSKTSNDTITGHVTFGKGFDVSTDVDVGGLVDRVDIKALLENTQQEDSNTLVNGKKF